MYILLQLKFIQHTENYSILRWGFLRTFRHNQSNHIQFINNKDDTVTALCAFSRIPDLICTFGNLCKMVLLVWCFFPIPTSLSPSLVGSLK